jgi:DUF1009 family protein
MARRLGVLAGEGELVDEVVAAALASGYAVRIVALGAPPEIEGVDIVRANLSDPQGAMRSLAEFGATHVTLVGRVGLDGNARQNIAQSAGGGARLGDVDLAGAVRGMLERQGLAVLGAHEIAPDLLAGDGVLAGPEVVDEALADCRFALGLARQVGQLDLGQAVVAAASRPIAVEDVAGTDALLDRVIAYRAQGLLPAGAERLVLAKAAKPQQPDYVDMPAIGADTVRRAAAAGISAVVVEAGRSLVLQREALVAAAAALGVSVIGLTADG